MKFDEQRRDPTFDKVNTSPSGRYCFAEYHYHQKPPWSDGREPVYRGLVYSGDRMVADLREVSPPAILWVENHFNGHNYLYLSGGRRCIEQTVVELDTGNRTDYVAAETESGRLFAVQYCIPSPDLHLVVTAGRYEGSPRGSECEFIFSRFDEPLSLPWPEIDRVTGGSQWSWSEDGFAFTRSENIRVSDGKSYQELTEREQREFNAQWRSVSGGRHRRYIWSPVGGAKLVEERFGGPFYPSHLGK